MCYSAAKTPNEIPQKHRICFVIIGFSVVYSFIIQEAILCNFFEVISYSSIHHSGVGRIARIKMLPMSLWESHESTGEVSLKELFDNKDYDIDGKSSLMTIEDLIFAASRGGWPASLLPGLKKHSC